MRITKPNRVRHTYDQNIYAEPARVMPLLCPVRECDWAVGWAPLEIHSHSGFTEPGCVFVTPAEPADAIWYVTQHDSVALRVEMIKITPGHSACRLNIQLVSTGESTTRATVSYEFTALSESGDQFVAQFDDAAWLEFMQAWENELNHFLDTGKMLAA